MSEPSFTGSKHGSSTKPRLALASKQSGIRLKSEDYPDQQMNQMVANSATTSTLAAGRYPVSLKDEPQSNPRETDLSHAENDVNKNLRQPNGTGRLSLNEEAKMNITKEDLLRLLSMLKSELQSKEIALAAIKCEQLKRLINPVEISRSSLASTYIELQDRFRARDQNNNTKNISKNDVQSSSSALTKQNQRNLEMSNATQRQTRPNSQDLDDYNDESLNMLNTLLELLDRHPLLALPRDSIYCSDYNCNELSTKNYLNLKIHHLDNLINQHRRFRFYMNERLRRSEQRYLELTRELELERNLKYKDDKSPYKTGAKSVLLKHIDQLTECLEKEKASKQAIVMTLLNDLLDERKKSENLAEKLAELVKMSKESSEREELIRVETELTNLATKLRNLSTSFAKERDELQARITELETENATLKAKLEPSSPATKGVVSQQSTNSARPVNSNGPVRQASKSVAVNTRTPSGPSNTKPILTPNVRSPTNSNNAIQSGTPNRTPLSSSGSGGVQTSATPSRVTIAGSSVSQKPPVLPKPIGGFNKRDQATPVRIQPLFKSASVMSTNQQVKNLKTTATATSIVVDQSRGSTSNQPTNL